MAKFTAETFVVEVQHLMEYLTPQQIAEDIGVDADTVWLVALCARARQGLSYPCRTTK
jgi:hypothetical protein